jgi:hypothetical protein
LIAQVSARARRNQQIGIGQLQRRRTGSRSTPILQIYNYCRYTNQPAKLTPATFDFAVENYFAVM